MKKLILSCIILTLLIVGGVYYFLAPKSETLGAQTNSPIFREIDQFDLNPSQTNPKPITVPATKLPEFTIDLTAQKFQSILASSGEKFKKLVEAKIIYQAEASEKIEASVTVNQQKNKLIIHPKDAPNFKPGMYKLSLTLRTLEGDVNIEQDFSWGVIAVNTNKSIYKPDETAKIGIGVLDNGGNTQCVTGAAHVDDLKMIITDPQGKTTNYSITDNTIFDSGECGPTTVTNQADFQAVFTTTTSGIYQMKVTAVVDDQERTIEDYFKVDSIATFDVERTSFPTRIFPHSMYPTTFTVTAKQNYQGKIEEIVPAFFNIQHVSDNGQIQKAGEFTKIVWHVNLQANTPKTFTYFIKFPLISPEFYLLGPITIGDFKEARQWQIASDAINSTSGLISYEDNGGNNTFSRIWTGTTWSPALGGPGSTMDTSPADSRWFREVSSPKTGEKIVAALDNVAGGDRLFVFTWNGTAWNEDKNMGINGTGIADETRGFDVAYEEESGDALLVFSDYSNSQLKYIKRVAGTWDTASSSAGLAFGTAPVFKKWVRLEAQFNSDKILVGYINSNQQVGAMMWNGATNTFENQFDETASTLTATSDEQSFDIAWETSSGTPMIFWGTTGNLLTMREFTADEWQPESTVASTFTQDIDWVFVAADPVSTSNNISIILQQGTACLIRMGIWTGSAATMNGTTPTCDATGLTTNNLVDTAFEYKDSKAMFVYVVDNGALDDDITWVTWTSAGGFTSPVTEAMDPDVIEGMQLYSDLNTRSMMLLFHDSAATCDLYAMQWDGQAWNAPAVVYDNMCDDADNNTEPYGFGFDRNLETQVAYRWFANANTNDGGATLSPLTTQDTAYTLTSANQQFRLRFLLYYPDSLAIGARTYKLQYVDPGSGSCSVPSAGTPVDWTDVGNVGSTREIAYFPNTNIASASAVSTNASDPTYAGKTKINQTYNEQNTFTTIATTVGDRLGVFDFSLTENTTFDRIAQTFCFRVVRSNDLALRTATYPQIRTASIPDVLIQGGSLIQGGTRLQ